MRKIALDSRLLDTLEHQHREEKEQSEKCLRELQKLNDIRLEIPQSLKSFINNMAEYNDLIKSLEEEKEEREKNLAYNETKLRNCKELLSEIEKKNDVLVSITNNSLDFSQEKKLMSIEGVKQKIIAAKNMRIQLQGDVTKLSNILNPSKTPESSTKNGNREKKCKIEDFPDEQSHLNENLQREDDDERNEEDADDSHPENKKFEKYFLDYEAKDVARVFIKDPEFLKFLHSKFVDRVGPNEVSAKPSVKKFWSQTKNEIPQEVVKELQPKERSRNHSKCTLCDMKLGAKRSRVYLSYWHNDKFQECTKHPYHVECAAFMMELQNQSPCLCIGMTRYTKDGTLQGKVKSCWEKSTRDSISATLE